MKTMATHLSLMLRLGQRKSNLRLLIKFAGVLVLLFVFYSEDCPPMGAENKRRLAEYMHQFKFDV